MNAASIPRFVPRRRERQRTAATFPRARKPRTYTLTELVRLVLNRASASRRPFGVFVFDDGRAVLWGCHTRHYDEFARRYPKAFVGAYDASLDVLAFVEDLRDFLGGAAG